MCWKKLEVLTETEGRKVDAGSQRKNGCWSLGQQRKKKKERQKESGQEVKRLSESKGK